MSEVRKGQNGSGGGAQTLAEAAFIELRRQLLSGALQPGEPLRLERLKQDLKIGFTPLREALMRLSSEGLVLAEEQRGFRVAPATLADLEDIMTSRAEIEALALQRAIRLGGDDWRSEEHTSELQSLMRISYDVFCLKK